MRDRVTSHLCFSLLSVINVLLDHSHSVLHHWAMAGVEARGRESQQSPQRLHVWHQRLKPLTNETVTCKIGPNSIEACTYHPLK